MWSCNFLLQKVCAATSEKMGKKQQSDRTVKKTGVKNLIVKKYFSENYAYFLLILTLGERKKGVVLMGY